MVRNEAWKKSFLNKLTNEDYKPLGLLNLYGHYTGQKVFMALNCQAKDENRANLSYMSGVHYINNELCLFINLNKDSQKEDRLKYEDYFKSNNVLHWESQTDTSLTNKKEPSFLNIIKPISS